MNEIWIYTSQKWSVVQADKYYDLLIASFNQIVLNPNCGNSYDGVEPGLRGFRVEKHIVFYEQIDTKTIEIIRILHQSMDIESRF